MSHLQTENYDLKRSNRRLQQQVEDLNRQLARCRGELRDLVTMPQDDPAVDVGVVYDPTTPRMVTLTDE